MTKTKKRRADHGLTREQHKRKKEVTDLLRRFGKYLTVRRQQDNLPFRVVATRAGMAHSSVYQMEHMTHDPHLSELLKLAQAFNESLRQFLAPFLQDHDEELEAVAESGERRQEFTEIEAPQPPAPTVADPDVAPNREEIGATPEEQ